MKKTHDHLLAALFLTGFLFLGSCMADQDFKQMDELQVTPTFEASLLYVEAETDLLDDDETLKFSSSNSFNQNNFSKRLLEATLTYRMENTTGKSLDILVEFLNADGNVLDEEKFEAEAQETLERKVVYGPSGKSIDIIKNSTNMRGAISSSGGSSSSGEKIIFKSSAQFKMRLK